MQKLHKLFIRLQSDNAVNTFVLLEFNSKKNLIIAKYSQQNSMTFIGI